MIFIKFGTFYQHFTNFRDSKKKITKPLIFWNLKKNTYLWNIKKMKKMTDNRPLSPHLSIHKRVLTAVFSIFHRISGIGLSVGALLISIWFFLISFGPEFYIYFETLSKSILFKLVLMIWTVGIFYHLFLMNRMYP